MKGFPEKIIRLGDFSISNEFPMMLIAGPCALEGRDMAFRIAEHLVKVTDELKVPFVFKASFDKANRTSLNSKRGVQMDQALRIFQDLKKDFKCPIITDVHDACQCGPVSEVVDILQIPAFLCRQTDLLVAAALTQKVINIKKGQFLAPWDMENVCKKVSGSGNEKIVLCERGACFGYNQLVTDMRSLKIMQTFGYPVIFDATHSVQSPGGLGDSSGGNRDHIELLSRGAVSIGIAGVFIETHFDPKNAYSDGPNMVPLHAVRNFLMNIKKIDELAKEMRYIDMSC
ncbi:MAG: 3-deoxy-8-phosphooctulonate synthase [Holosporaceae bacterium]|jgi:2-dehydro-3-deoxyphosphooctonate aldolase (KDO 8-P synthase)|nr:3-deoxy-8-phosphooctulonate synthase [Holosporaceae bacterium]